MRRDGVPGLRIFAADIARSFKEIEQLYPIKRDRFAVPLTGCPL
jgi:hypothetical protein